MRLNLRTDWTLEGWMKPKSPNDLNFFQSDSHSDWMCMLSCALVLKNLEKSMSAAESMSAAQSRNLGRMHYNICRIFGLRCTIPPDFDIAQRIKQILDTSDKERNIKILSFFNDTEGGRDCNAVNISVFIHACDQIRDCTMESYIQDSHGSAPTQH